MPLRYIPALMIVIALIGSTIYSYQIESTYIKGMRLTSAELVALGAKSTSSTSVNGNQTTTNTQAIADFEVNNSVYRVEGRALGYPRWEIGQKVEVYFSEKNPNRARINRWDELYFFTGISALSLSFCLLFGMINFIVFKVRGRPLS